MTSEIPVSGTDRVMLVDDEVAEMARGMRWRWVAGQVVNEVGMVNFGLYGRKRVKFVDGDPFRCVKENLEGVGGNRTGRPRERKSASGIKGLHWDKSRNRWKIEGGRSFKELAEAVAFVRGGET